MNSVLRSGSTPAAIQSAALSMALAASSEVLAYSLVSACQSATKYRQSYWSCSAAQFLSAPTRWPMWSRPVGRIPETTRSFDIRSARKPRRDRRSRRQKHPADTVLHGIDDSPQQAAQEQPVQNEHSVRTKADVPARRLSVQQPGQDIATIERRHRDHVEDRKQHVDTQQRVQKLK